MAGEYAFLVILASVSSAIVFGGIAMALRARSELGFRIALSVLALALVASFVPAPEPPGYATMDGTLRGDATIPVARDEGAPLSVVGGEGQFASDALLLHCPSGCSFDAGTRSLLLPPYKRGVSLGGAEAPSAQVDGTLHVEDRHGACVAVPLIIAAVVPGVGCAACSLTEFDANASGPLREGVTRACS